MDPIEKAIRSAFEKGDAEDPAFREKVYRSAAAALERALKANPNVTVETAIKRRKSLEAKIAEIESEFLDAVPAIEIDTPAGSVPPVTASSGDRRDPDMTAAAAPSPEPRIAPEPGLAGSTGEAPAVSLDRPLAGNASTRPAAPRVDGSVGAPSPAASGRRDRPRGRPLAAAFMVITLLSILAIGVWWGIQTGLIKLPGQAEDTTPPQVVGDSEDFIPEEEDAPVKPGEADPQRNWIAVFEPADATAVTAPSDAKAEVMQDDSGSFLRVRSGASGSAVIFDVGQGILERIAGKKATFDIVARAEPEKETEMMVDCNFGELGDCGRKRYSVGRDKGDYLFELDMPKASPGAGGTIAINSDFGNGGKAVDIYAIRVSISE